MIYLASSWRNPRHTEALRQHEPELMYRFTSGLATSLDDVLLLLKSEGAA